MFRRGFLLALALAAAPADGRAQSISISSANAVGDCSGTSFYQSSDAGGKFVAADWAVPSQYAVGVNRGRVRCTIRFNVTVPVGHKLVPGGGSGLAHRLASAQLSPVRLNGGTTGVLVESAISIDAGGAATASALINGGPTTGASLIQDRAVGSLAVESVCSTATKSTFQLTAVLDAATASSYVVPWPPEPYAQRETASMRAYRLYYTVVPCAPSRAAAAEAVTLRP